MRSGILICIFTMFVCSKEFCQGAVPDQTRINRITPQGIPIIIGTGPIIWASPGETCPPNSPKDEEGRINQNFSSAEAEREGGLKKNSIYITPGFYLDETYFSIALNYERILVAYPKSFFQGIQLRAGAGPWVAWMEEGINVFSVASLLMGRSSSHFEIGIGILNTYWQNSKTWEPFGIGRENYPIATNIGYRYQKPGGQFVLRAGLGWPEGYYLSLGFCF